MWENITYRVDESTNCDIMGLGITTREIDPRVVIRVQLADLRKRRGLTQEELAAALGVTTSAVGNWEAGLRIPRYETLRRLAEVLEVSIDEIMFPAAQGGEKRVG